MNRVSPSYVRSPLAGRTRLSSETSSRSALADTVINDEVMVVTSGSKGEIQIPYHNAEAQEVLEQVEEDVCHASLNISRLKSILEVRSQLFSCWI